MNSNEAEHIELPDRGQATVELALTLPLIAVVLAIIVQLAVVAVGQLRVVDETRRVARAASLAEDPRIAAMAASTLDGASIDIRFDDSTVTVDVSMTISTNAPLIGRFTPPIVVRSRLTMAREPVTE